ncbi:MAG TPA: dienelactone hydrolase family protein [Caulobacterales bacterium]|nr:dienelactone hydrolase family protein [Caulobacterales bacterium]
MDFRLIEKLHDRRAARNDWERFYMGKPEKWETLADFEARQLTFLGQEKLVFATGAGPAVILMAEMPGISEEQARLARWLRDAGFSVFMPHLFGEAMRPVTAVYALTTMARACMAREFAAFAANKSSPVTAWLRALAAHAHGERGGKGVGAIGMCFTGNFALSMMLEKAMLAPVLSQPSLPMGDGAGLHIAPDELARVKARLEAEDLTVKAYRFAGDRFCPAAKFEKYERALGARFEGVTLPDSAANPNARLKMPHCVLTSHLIDEPHQPTRQAVDDIIAFFRARLV